MLCLKPLLWMLKCIFSCNHWRTPVNEGKCYCPDCGRGVIYQWVIIRCQTCRVRVDSHTVLRQVMPRHKCCPYCGENAFQLEYLESPSYFQLHKAQLSVREEQDYLQTRSRWSVYSFGESVGRTMEHTITKARYWLQASRPHTTGHPALLPVRVTG
jgi:hypothetical protein